MITVVRLTELLRHSIIVCLRQEPFYGGTLFGLKHKKKHEISNTRKIRENIFEMSILLN